MWHAVFLASPFAQFSSKACEFQVSHTYQSNLLHTKLSLNRTWRRASTGPRHLVTWQRRANSIVILVFLKGFCWGSTFQRSTIVPSINTDRSFSFYWAALNQQGGIFRSFSCVWFVTVTASAKVMHVWQAGWAQVLHVCPVVLCVLSTVNTLKLPEFKQTQMEKHARGTHCD